MDVATQQEMGVQHFLDTAIVITPGIWLTARVHQGKFSSLGRTLSVGPPRSRRLWQSPIALAKNPVFHDRSKHIDVKFHFIRDCVEERVLEIEHVGTQNQLADILTKALGRVRFFEIRQKLAVMEGSWNT